MRSQRSWKTTPRWWRSTSCSTISGGAEGGCPGRWLYTDPELTLALRPNTRRQLGSGLVACGVRLEVLRVTPTASIAVARLALHRVEGVFHQSVHGGFERVEFGLNAGGSLELH